MSEFVTASGTRYRSHADYMGDLPRLLGEAKVDCESRKELNQMLQAQCQELLSERDSARVELAELKSRTRPLDVNKDAMVLFLEAAEQRGFVIQLVPPEKPR